MESMAGTRAPARLWVDPATVEYEALNQVRNAANLPWTHGVALMPDAHLGKGACVGSVIAMDGAVSPATVGVDIGCGMTAVQVQMTADQLPDDLSKIRSAIEAVVPVGQSSHDIELTKTRAALSGLGGWDEFIGRYDDLTFPLSTKRLAADAYKQRVLSQLGTLGGGNHFIEVCTDQNNGVWLMLHSGSRNVAKELAERHIAVAKTLEHNQGIVDRDLAVFVTGTPEMDAYRHDLWWAQEYAARNRAVMMGLVKLAFGTTINDSLQGFGRFGVEFGKVISCHHNYVSEEVYDGKELLITRKGAISAHHGTLGLIPGSMGTGSYVVEGLGNTASFCSASHGAGRKMSRTRAKAEFTVADLEAQTAGVECRKDAGVVDEIPGAYKDLATVMAQQTDLVRIVTKLDTIVCVKG